MDLQTERGSDGASEQMSAVEAKRANKQCGVSEKVRGAIERARRRANGPVLYASISYTFYPLCTGGATDGLSYRGNG